VDGESQTRVAGLLAAGDIRRGSPRNVAAAVRDGRVAAASARRTLEATK
jgi:thioredoxin reductase